MMVFRDLEVYLAVAYCAVCRLAMYLDRALLTLKKLLQLFHLRPDFGVFALGELLLNVSLYLTLRSKPLKY